MGIPKLTGFISHKFQFKKVQVQGNLVIDGSSLCYNLYFQHHKWEIGGEYHEFYGTVVDYISGLKSLGIKPYVVMDGIDFDDSKLPTHNKRCNQKFERIATLQSGRGAMENTVHFSVVPLLAKKVFFDALRASGVDVFVADEEADQSIVALANFLRCPVMGNDSDFFIFNIECGYVPITDSNNSLVDLRSLVDCFLYHEFDEKFSLSREQRLFLPLLLGNDFHERVPFPRLRIDFKTPVHKVIKTVSNQLRTDADIRRFCGESAVGQMAGIRAYYNSDPQSFENLSSSQCLSDQFPIAPKWVLDLYKQGRFSSNLLHLMLSQSKIWRYLVVVEDMKEESAWKAAEDCLSRIVSLVLPPATVNFTLTDRHGLVLETMSVIIQRLAPGTSPVTIPTVSVDRRRDMILEVFGCEAVSALIQSEEIDSTLKMVVIASRYWLQTNPSYEKWLQALVACFLFCLDSRSRSPHCRGKPSLNFISAFAQWQCILHHVIILNQALNFPFPESRSIPAFYSAAIVQHYCENPPKLDRRAQALIRGITNF